VLACLQLRDALFPALVAIGYCGEPDTDELSWLSVRSAKDAAQILVDSGAVDVEFESADIVLLDAIELATDLVTGDFGAARTLLIDRRAQLHMRMTTAIDIHREEDRKAAEERQGEVSAVTSRSCLAAMRHVLNVARGAGLNTGQGTGACDDQGQPLDLFVAAAKVAALFDGESKLVLKEALANFDALRAWGYERHLWHDYILRAAPLVAARDVAAAADLAAVTNVFETRRYADFFVGESACHMCVTSRPIGALSNYPRPQTNHQCPRSLGERAYEHVHGPN